MLTIRAAKFRIGLNLWLCSQTLYQTCKKLNSFDFEPDEKHRQNLSRFHATAKPVPSNCCFQVER